MSVSIDSVHRRALNELLPTKAEEAPNVTVPIDHELLQADLENKTLTINGNWSESCANRFHFWL